jgi:hypothetical protein
MRVSISYWLKKWLKVRLRPDAFLTRVVAMSKDSWARLRVAALIYCMVNAVVFGIGTILVMSLPVLMFHAFFWIPVVVASSFVISAPLSWFIAPWMMMRFARTPII